MDTGMPRHNGHWNMNPLGSLLSETWGQFCCLTGTLRGVQVKKKTLQNADALSWVLLDWVALWHCEHMKVRFCFRTQTEHRQTWYHWTFWAYVWTWYKFYTLQAGCNKISVSKISCSIWQSMEQWDRLDITRPRLGPRWFSSWRREDSKSSCQEISAFRSAQII